MITENELLNYTWTKKGHILTIWNISFKGYLKPKLIFEEKWNTLDA